MQCPDVREYRDVWVYVEHTNGRAAAVSWELLTPARRLADALGVTLSVVIIGDSGARIATEAFAYGADVAYTIDGPAFRYYRTETHLLALAQLIRRHKPEILLFGATPTGSDLAAAVAIEAKTGLVADCTSLELDMETRLLEMTRPAFGGNVMATVLCEKHRPQMATVRPRVMSTPLRRPGRAGRIQREEFSLPEAEIATKLLQYAPYPPEVMNLREAQIIVAAGRGIGSAENLRVVLELATALGGAIGATRAVVDRGWLNADFLIGQSGKTVCPRLYVAVGISGAARHVQGMRHAEMILAINHDPNAPIFAVATHGIVGDLFQVVPELTHQVLTARNPVAIAY